jgi:hypothetical protein
LANAGSRDVMPADSLYLNTVLSFDLVLSFEQETNNSKQSIKTVFLIISPTLKQTNLWFYLKNC